MMSVLVYWVRSKDPLQVHLLLGLALTPILISVASEIPNLGRKGLILREESIPFHILFYFLVDRIYLSLKNTLYLFHTWDEVPQISTNVFDVAVSPTVSNKSPRFSIGQWNGQANIVLR
mmetsp:Transcript_10994/g.26594  ORF Transcript_10994/g.26594 Transcript_10994/m.26594 type:complete len:119 (-) Transcript_10994:134-490(-)